MEDKYAGVADWLDLQASAVRELETQALKALNELKNEGEYRRLMKEKALLLISLPEAGAACVELLGEPQGRKILSTLKRFSKSASSAVSIGSVFFMSALLYPEDYKEGDPNDLEIFAQNVRSMGQ